MKADLKGLDASETEQWAVSQGLKPYQGRQIRRWLFKMLASSFDEMTDLSKDLRKDLKDRVIINLLEIVNTQQSKDGTKKYLFKLHDGHFIESVLIPEEDHSTICISSQAGCAMGCLFCSTARQGLKRNLTVSEIIEQVIQVRRLMDAPERLTNIVLMGMGEPLANYDSVIRAVGNIIASDGMNFSTRKVTLSTCGLVPQIKMLGRDITVNLAVSLNASDDKTRSLLMPVNRIYPLTDLISALRDFPLPNRRMLTFEYILIKGVNDSEQDARRLADLLSGLRSKINLIPLNPFPGSDMSCPPMDDILRFQDILVENHYTAIIRKGRGSDISAACGQLSGGYNLPHPGHRG
ncbi:Dual-specificity RNA methyltransferase RlmN [uncultured Desulfobacterium sp.]|uniref:Probable dual-specificity RNA methyltransferase RlmN n=1 Tax=uncultured Desulfobacterium sp. TaxID=201089 RepID=A0A445MRU6_9BACT|nr:Dual-specificity RNA methyltransferase RlmN [uncultured Desulfobacterium sp.]